MTELASVGEISLATKLAKARRNYVATETICVATEFASVGKHSVMIEYFYVATKLAKVRRNYVATETICVATKLVGTKNSATHDRTGVQGLRVQRHALRAHSTEARATDFVATDFTQLLCCDRLLTAMLSR